ncbi:MAG: hypothetical protein AAGM84_14275 [Pseudomonadota bacterium]
MTVREGKDGRQMDELDKMLERARDAEVPTGLMGRVLEDALAVQPVPRPAPQPVWARLREAVGGWQGVGGLALATCAGFWIGVAPPDYLPGAAQDLLGAEYAAADVGAFGWALEDIE